MKVTGLKSSAGVWGGDLVDLGYPWAARDKVQHLLGGALLFAFLSARGLPAFWAFGAVAFVAVLNEALEGYRLRRYGPNVLLADEPDVTDALVTLAGAILGWLLL